MTIDYKKMLGDLLPLIEAASEMACELYQAHIDRGLSYEVKKDQSIVSEADMQVEAFLLPKLLEITPDIPVVSEEDYAKQERVLEQADRFWLLDPIDGTRHFFEKVGDFSINLALIVNQKPVLGMINIPTRNVTYYAFHQGGCFKKAPGQMPEEVHTPHETILKTVITSNITQLKKINAIQALFPNVKHVMCGSAIKFCELVEGRAQLYPKLSSIMEWDTAAGQVILEEAGGGVFDLKMKPLSYHKPLFRNPPFFAINDVSMIEKLDIWDKIES